VPNPGVILLVRRAFKAAFIDNPLHVVRDGEEAIAYLQGEGMYSNRAENPLPSLILLDLKMPRLDGLGVLRWIRSQQGFSGTAVVILSSSDQPENIRQAYEAGATSFHVKPTSLVELERFVKAMSSLGARFGISLIQQS